ncbi:MAG TPA: hypothetical protein VF765_08795 [Polyangiaceae bacterium]
MRIRRRRDDGPKGQQIVTGARRLAFAAISLLLACGGGGPAALRPETAGAMARSVGKGRPPLGVVARDGDAGAGVAVAVSTEGLAADRGAVAGVSLAALVEARLAAKGVPAEAVGGWGGWRLRALAAAAGDAAGIVAALRDAMLAPVTAGEPALEAVRRKVEALGKRPLADRALLEVARCTGEPFGLGADPGPTAAELESWRAAAHGLGRVAFGVAGNGAMVRATGDALASGPAWPAAAPFTPAPWATGEEPVGVYDASGEVAPGAARVVVTAWTGAPERAVAAAAALADAHGALASRLAALDAPARVTSVVATAHPEGGCVAAWIDVAARDLGGDVPARIATAAALARQEVAVELADTTASPDLGERLALDAADPRDAAERAAWWSLAGRAAGHERDARVGLFVGVAVPRDAPPGAAAPAGDIRAAIDRATLAWHAPVVEARVRVERGQGETWVLLASPCGTLPEGAGDAGSGAAVAEAAALQSGPGTDARVEPFVATDAVGVLAHGPARPGESPAAQARRIGDLAARALAGEPLDPGATTRARTVLLARAGQLDARVLGALGAASAPGHPSWVDPLGTALGIGSGSDDELALRAAAVRAGPLRVAVLANADTAQADAAVRAADRWIARRPGEVRACTPAPTPVVPRAGTYAVPLPAGATPEALLGIPLPPGDDDARVAATWIAAALGGSDGLLAHALGGASSGAASALANASSAAVLGAPRAPVLAIRVAADDASLDAAVAQVRALLDRLRQGALREEDRARAAQSLARTALAASLDPRARTIELWRGASPSPAPSLEALRAFAASNLHDDGLVIVAARVPRAPPPAPRDKKATK